MKGRPGSRLCTVVGRKVDNASADESSMVYGHIAGRMASPEEMQEAMAMRKALKAQEAKE